MDDLALARGLHLLSVVLWIGGVAFVTTVLLPAARRQGDRKAGITMFDRVEGIFVWQARATTLIAGASGLYLLVRMDLWERFLMPAFWWLHAMVLVWLVFTAMLFVLEPLVLDKWFQKRAARDPDGTLAIIQRLHWVMLTVSLVTLFAAAAGAHGWLIF